MNFLPSLSLPLLLLRLLLPTSPPAEAAALTLTNNCRRTIWPGLLSGAGHPPLSTTGFELSSRTSRSVDVPPGWSGRLWARTGCSFDPSGAGSCATADCGSGELPCNGRGAAPPATLAEFTLAGGTGELDFYDVSLVDGFNLPVAVEGGNCAVAGCAVDVNTRCPSELRVGEGDGAACRSACDAFGRPEFCCSGEFGSPGVCGPTAYSELFKAACPRSYSYAFDDAASIFTCSGAGEYTVVFCPEAALSPKTPANPWTSPTTTGGVTVENDAWLANLATNSGSERNSALPSMLPSMGTPFLLSTSLCSIIICVFVFYFTSQCKFLAY